MKKLSYVEWVLETIWNDWYRGWNINYSDMKRKEDEFILRWNRSHSALFARE